MANPGSSLSSASLDEFWKAMGQVEKEFEEVFGPSIRKTIQVELEKPIEVKDIQKPTDTQFEEQVKIVEDLVRLATSFANTSEDYARFVYPLQDILIRIKKSGFLIRSEMELVNKVYKVLHFEAKHHPDRQTTVGRIQEILGGMNGEK